MKKPECLPDWFDIKNYDSVANMDLLGWAHALQFREFLTSKWAKYIYKTNEELVERLADVSKNPLDGDVSCSDDFRKLALLGINPPHRYYLSGGNKSVDSLRIGMIGAIWGDITSEGDAAKFKLDLEVGSLQGNPELEDRFSRIEDATYDEFYLTQFQKKDDEDDLEYNSRYFQYLGGFTFAKVELGAPDERLIEDFKKWLKNTRDLIGVPTHPQKYTATDMADWHSKRVLPYIDLTIWAKLMQVKINQQQIGNVLFPDDYDTSLSDRIRKSVKPLAKNLMWPSTLGAICMQADMPDN